MATLNSAYPTLIDVATRLDPDGKIAKIVEILNTATPFIEDAMVLEGNQATGHVTTLRRSLATGGWRKFNQGVPLVKTTTSQITEAFGMFAAYSEVDAALSALNGNSVEWRATEDRAIIQGMSQQMEEAFFYSNNATNPEQILGLAPRYAAKTGLEQGENILLGGGTASNNTSIWLIVWGPDTVFTSYPKGSTAGLQMKDLGERTLKDANGNQYQGLRSYYEWKTGLVIRDWQAVVRIANIDVTQLTKNGASGADLIDLLTQAIELPKPSVMRSGTPMIYANRTITSFLRRQIVNKVASSSLMMDNVAGKRVISFDGIPVRRADAILNTEATIV
jgi:hypothetical protein